MLVKRHQLSVKKQTEITKKSPQSPTTKLSISSTETFLKWMTLQSFKSTQEIARSQTQWTGSAIW